MPIPQPKQPVSVNKVIRHASGMPNISSLATGPSLAPIGNPTPAISTIGNESQSRTIPIPELQEGATHTITAIIPFSQLPSILTSQQTIGGAKARQNFTSRVGDRVQFQVTPTIANAPFGISVTSVTATPMARAPSSQLYMGPTLPGGHTFTTFSTKVVITLSAIQASAATQLNVNVNGILTLQQGQGS